MLMLLVVYFQLKEALDVLDLKMLKRDGRKPDMTIYVPLITACGRRGYTEKAFKLYNDVNNF
jgi:pentatricopeptide repeat protein